MIAIVQVAKTSSVQITGKPETTRSIGKGFLFLLGVSRQDTEKDLEKLFSKLLKLRVFSDENQKMNLDISTVKGEVLLISQFTLLGSLKGNNRPDFSEAAGKELAQKLYKEFADKLIEAGVPTTLGYFGEHMEINSELIGPVTITLDSANL